MNRTDRETLELYCEESAERLDRIGSALDGLGAGPPVDLDVLHGIFRDTHTLKSGANLLGLRPVERLCHKLEDLLDRIRSGADVPDPALVELLRAGYGRIGALLDNLHLLPLIDVSRDLADIDRRLAERRSAGR